MKAYHITGGWQPESYYYTNYFEAMDGDPKKIRVADSAPDGGALILPSFMTAGRAILPDHVPSKLRRGGPGIKRQPLLDFNSWISGTLLVPQMFREILEDLEPRMHQFFPMEYFENEARIGEGYLFIFGKRVDTLHDTACWPGRDERGFPEQAARREDTRVVHSAAKIGRHHAWVEKFTTGRRISGEFAERLQAEKLSGINYNPMMVEP